MRLCKPSPNQQGLTLIELVMSIALLAIGMTGIYLVIQTVAQHLWEPEKSYQAMNVADYYRDQILAVETGKGCPPISEELKPWTDKLCQHSSHAFEGVIDLEHLGQTYRGWKLFIRMMPKQKDLYRFDMRVVANNQNLLDTHYLKAAP